MSTVRALVRGDLPGDALQQLNVAHLKVTAARMKHGIAESRVLRESSPESFAEIDRAAAEIEQTEEVLLRAWTAYGIAVGLLDDPNETSPGRGNGTGL